LSASVLKILDRVRERREAVDAAGLFSTPSMMDFPT
jgi:hypothetical protein